ncbi:uncharacterized protein Tco025E_00188 [Trypanosoma conorhini]|uniref:Uncharacterized protein n=1 Tax=Trypanosoma conorhini TaxID=83891 RepID=A0A422QC45_9TRYP|nr:uncharacterized protein Tco025E_00188 [Trypanosoma conorhini]RNF27538.1 hypothetical protein Tco025E_00188 [Trypanosoma conorhini]
MSSWVSAEHFLQSKSASYVRRGLLLFIFYGVASDYYLMHYYQAFDPAEGRRYVIDWSPIGRPRCQVHVVPSNHYPNYTPWTPRNGDVVLARSVPNEPNWLQLISGRFIEQQTCGVRLAIPLEEVQEQERQRQKDEAELKNIYSDRNSAAWCQLSRVSLSPSRTASPPPTHPHSRPLLGNFQLGRCSSFVIIIFGSGGGALLRRVPRCPLRILHVRSPLTPLLSPPLSPCRRAVALPRP